ncbi:MAG: hypothetical protein CM15mP128_1540 [Methanobacteriota archaeon]|nr:MAG: hypothetical protein CM15mP128_1540 [Euryarchaeota archaeon]
MVSIPGNWSSFSRYTVRMFMMKFRSLTTRMYSLKPGSSSPSSLPEDDVEGQLRTFSVWVCKHAHGDGRETIRRTSPISVIVSKMLA